MSTAQRPYWPAGEEPPRLADGTVDIRALCRRLDERANALLDPVILDDAVPAAQPADTTDACIVADAHRLADAIRHEVAACTPDVDALRTIARAATTAVDIIREARAHAEAAFVRARETAS